MAALPNPTATHLAFDLADCAGVQATSEFHTQAQAVIQIVSALAASHTRGQGFTDGEPADDLRAVILSASLRRLTDPTQTVTDRSMGPFSTTYRPNDGWSTWELATLNRYRQRAM